MSSIESLRAPAISRLENWSVDFVCEPVDKKGKYIKFKVEAFSLGSHHHDDI